MAVKRSRSAGRMLVVFEAIASAQPIGVSALARRLDANKSAVQRDLMTLADAGWIRLAPGAAAQWELAPHVLTLARPPHSSERLRQRARPLLEQLRAETGETAYLTMPDGDHFVVIDAAESFQMLRMVPPVGIVIPMEGSATARAILPHLGAQEQGRLLGGQATAALERELAAIRERGYAVNDGEIEPSAVAMAAAVLDRNGVPVGTLVLTGPGERLRGERRAELGAKLKAAAEQLSAAAG
ncbi:MAG: IclR family transcriptional regulator [Novosphingobium sp.]|nr:IclR family transcriptional regulator [Novosphingobium sp.]